MTEQQAIPGLLLFWYFLVQIFGYVNLFIETKFVPFKTNKKLKWKQNQH